MTNILVIDDDPANVRLLSDLLEQQGFGVRSVPGRAHGSNRRPELAAGFGGDYISSTLFRWKKSWRASTPILRSDGCNNSFSARIPYYTSRMNVFNDSQRKPLKNTCWPAPCPGTPGTRPKPAATCSGFRPKPSTAKCANMA